MKLRGHGRQVQPQPAIPATATATATAKQGAGGSIAEIAIPITSAMALALADELVAQAQVIRTAAKVLADGDTHAARIKAYADILLAATAVAERIDAMPWRT